MRTYVEPIPVFVFDSASADRLYTIGGTGFQNNLVEMAGGKNIFGDLEKDFADVSMEELVARNPEAIIIVEYYTADLGKEKIAFLGPGLALCIYILLKPASTKSTITV